MPTRVAIPGHQLVRPPAAALLAFVLLSGAASGCAQPPQASTPRDVAATSGEPAATAASGSATSAVALKASLDALRAAYLAPGALAVVVDGDTRIGAASGRAAEPGGGPVTDTARFRVGSITKPIIAALVLMAVDRGELTLDTVASDILPGVLRAEPPVTIRQLLAHTSGVFDEGNEGDLQADVARLTDAALRADAANLLARYAKGEPVVASPEILVGLAETHDRYFQPGTGYHYSNINYQLLGMVLERVGGRPLDVLLQTRIVEPLGLRATTLAPADTASPDLRGYDSTATGAMVDLTDNLAMYGNGANGGVISNADELLEILRAIVSGRLFPANLVAEMENPVRESYGLGLGTSTFRCGTFYGHGGSVSGTQSIAAVSPDAQRGIVVAINLKAPSDPGLPKVAEQALCGG